MVRDGSYPSPPSRSLLGEGDKVTVKMLLPLFFIAGQKFTRNIYSKCRGQD